MATIKTKMRIWKEVNITIPDEYATPYITEQANKLEYSNFLRMLRSKGIKYTIV